MALAHVTGGQYVPLKDAQSLAKIIVGGAHLNLFPKQTLKNKEIDGNIKPINWVI